MSSRYTAYTRLKIDHPADLVLRLTFDRPRPTIRSMRRQRKFRNHQLQPKRVYLVSPGAQSLSLNPDCFRRLYAWYIASITGLPSCFFAIFRGPDFLAALFGDFFRALAISHPNRSALNLSAKRVSASIRVRGVGRVAYRFKAATWHSNERVRRLPDRLTCGAPPLRRSHPRSDAPSVPIRAKETHEADIRRCRRGPPEFRCSDHPDNTRQRRTMIVRRMPVFGRISPYMRPLSH